MATAINPADVPGTRPQPARDELAEVLAPHQRYINVSKGGAGCRCGEWPPPAHDVPFYEHLADAILASPWLAEFAAAQRAAGASAERARVLNIASDVCANHFCDDDAETCICEQIEAALPTQPRPAQESS